MVVSQTRGLHSGHFPQAAARGARQTGIEQYAFEFDRTLNAVKDFGMDSTGRDLIDRAVSNTGQNNLIQFPDGEYRFDPYSGGLPLDGELFGRQATSDEGSFVVPEGYSN